MAGVWETPQARIVGWIIDPDYTVLCACQRRAEVILAEDGVDHWYSCRVCASREAHDEIAEVISRAASGR